jgi:major membrane immunogen (membrane-anchored lipoprotein)
MNMLKVVVLMLLLTACSFANDFVSGAACPDTLAQLGKVEHIDVESSTWQILPHRITRPAPDLVLVEQEWQQEMKPRDEAYIDLPHGMQLTIRDGKVDATIRLPKDSAGRLGEYLAHLAELSERGYVVVVDVRTAGE